MIRVMVAEDHTIVREGIKQLIGMARDMQVVGEAANGQQLLDQLRGSAATWCCWTFPCPASTASRRSHGFAR